MWDFFRRKNLRSVSQWLLTCLFALAPLPALPAPPITQKNAQAVAEDLNRKASDQSMQGSTTSAMKALMNFASGEMPSAVSNGMTAYGKYRNSENLDKLGDQNTLNEVSMVSFGNGQGSGVSAAKTPAHTSTSFRRLDPSFLRQGEADRVAAEFERQSGMKREDFLKEMSAVSEKKISRNDPQLMDKVLSRFESFASRIPNAEFRGKLEAGIKKVPETVRTGLISKAISKFSGFMAGAEPSPTAPVTPPAKTEASATTAAAIAPMVVAAPPPSDIGNVTLPSAPARIGSNNSDLLGNVINAAIHTQTEDPSIFEMVSRRYRTVTPLLSKKIP